MDFERYLQLGKVKRKTPDAIESEELLRKAERRIRHLTQQEITAENADFIFEGAYESCREAAQALMSLKGFKPYSHEATISFLKETRDFSDEELNMLDRFRRLRNDAIYKAVPVLAIDTKEALEFARYFIKRINGFA